MATCASADLARGEIADVHMASGGTYGALRVTAELRRGRDVVVGRNAVNSMVRTRPQGPADPPAPKGAGVSNVTSLDLVRREFRRNGPDQLG